MNVYFINCTYLIHNMTINYFLLTDRIQLNIENEFYFVVELTNYHATDLAKGSLIIHIILANLWGLVIYFPLSSAEFIRVILGRGEVK